MPESAVWSSVCDRNFGGHIPTIQGHLSQGCAFLCFSVYWGFRGGKFRVGPQRVSLWAQRSEIAAVALMQTHARRNVFSSCGTARDTSLAPEIGPPWMFKRSLK